MLATIALPVRAPRARDVPVDTEAVVPLVVPLSKATAIPVSSTLCALASCCCERRTPIAVPLIMLIVGAWTCFFVMAERHHSECTASLNATDEYEPPKSPPDHGKDTTRTGGMRIAHLHKRNIDDEGCWPPTYARIVYIIILVLLCAAALGAIIYTINTDVRDLLCPTKAEEDGL
jgi:hypothetical protein